MIHADDPVNWLASVLDPSGTTTYSYDAVGNLAAYAYPNGVSTGYGYDNLNRLTSMQSTCGTAAPGCGPANTIISSYTYTLGPTGNRQTVAELSGRSVTYGYDDLYRLTSETVASDPRGNNGQVTYTLDSVGNRLQRSSTLPAITATGLLNYDANDRISTDSYDPNGNTVFNSGQTNVYDFENRLVQRGGVKIVYDGDGNRVQETVAGITTSYLVADQNPTGYAQVLDELQGGAVARTYSYGLELINERQSLSGKLTTSFYGYDGHGSVRFLTDSTGAITDTYDYDAFGNLISSTGSAPNNYLFAGEQFDPALGIYYNRARYYDQRQGRFWTMDTFEGDPQSPTSLHRYLYASQDPITRHDPSGNDDLVEFAAANGISQTLQRIATLAVKGFLFGAGFGAADATLGGKDAQGIFDEAIRGGLIGAAFGPLTEIRFVAPVLIAFGTAAGVNGTLDSIESGNYAQAALRAAFSLIGVRTFIADPEPPPATGGRLGSAATRAQIAELAQNLMSRGWTITGGGGVQPEEYLPPIGGGRSGGNYVDITATKNGAILRVNTIDTLSDGVTPTSREAAAAALIRSKIGPSAPFLLIPKNR